MLVVEPFELVQGVQEMALVPNQGAVQQLSPAGLHSPFHDLVHARHADTAEDDLDFRIREDGIEQGGELPVPVADQEPGAAAGGR
ncbi:hypothetical protein [Streptomyces sp. SYSU K217416]